jgi:hypothetical protein
VVSTFYLNNADPSTIRQVNLFTINGSLVKTWKMQQPSYNMEGVAKGMYVLKITTTDEAVQYIKLVKQ